MEGTAKIIETILKISLYSIKNYLKCVYVQNASTQGEMKSPCMEQKYLKCKSFDMGVY